MSALKTLKKRPKFGPQDLLKKTVDSTTKIGRNIQSTFTWKPPHPPLYRYKAAGCRKVKSVGCSSPTDGFQSIGGYYNWTNISMSKTNEICCLMHLN